MKKYSEGLTEEEEDKLLKENGCRRLTANEFLTYCHDKKFDDYLPCRIQILNGPVVRGSYDGYDDRRYVNIVIDRPSDSLGVLGTPIEEKKKLKGKKKVKK